MGHVTAHAMFSASGTKDWKACAGRAPLYYEFARQVRPSGYAAKEGTAAHKLLETCIKSNTRRAEKFRGRFILVFPDDGTSMLQPGAMPPKLRPDHTLFEVTDEMAAAVQVALDYVASRIAPKSFAQALRTQLIRIESKVNPFPGFDAGGTADIIINLWPDILEVVDYKHGKGIFVPAKRNEQLLTYLGGVHTELDWEYSEYRGTIIQPRHWQAQALDPDGRGVISDSYTVHDILEFITETREAIMRGEAARAVFKGKCNSHKDALRKLNERGHLVPGDQCNWCDFRIDCPAALNAASADTCGDFMDDPDDIPVPDEPDKLARIVAWAPYIRDLLQAAEQEITARLEQDPSSVPGWKLEEKEGNRQWREGLPEKVIKSRIVKKYGVPAFSLMTEERIIPSTLISGPQALKLIPAKRRAEFEKEFLERPITGKKLVRTRTATEDFDE